MKRFFVALSFICFIAVNASIAQTCSHAKASKTTEAAVMTVKAGDESAAVAKTAATPACSHSTAKACCKKGGMKACTPEEKAKCAAGKAKAEANATEAKAVVAETKG